MDEKNMIVDYEIQHIRSEINRAKEKGMDYCDIYGELSDEAVNVLYDSGIRFASFKFDDYGDTLMHELFTEYYVFWDEHSFRKFLYFQPSRMDRRSIIECIVLSVFVPLVILYHFDFIVSPVLYYAGVVLVPAFAVLTVLDIQHVLKDSRKNWKKNTIFHLHNKHVEPDGV